MVPAIKDYPVLRQSRNVFSCLVFSLALVFSPLHAQVPVHAQRWASNSNAPSQPLQHSAEDSIVTGTLNQAVFLESSFPQGSHSVPEAEATLIYNPPPPLTHSNDENTQGDPSRATASRSTPTSPSSSRPTLHAHAEGTGRFSSPRLPSRQLEPPPEGHISRPPSHTPLSSILREPALPTELSDTWSQEGFSQCEVAQLAGLAHASTASQNLEQLHNSTQQLPVQTPSPGIVIPGFFVVDPSFPSPAPPGTPGPGYFVPASRPADYGNECTVAGVPPTTVNWNCPNSPQTMSSGWPPQGFWPPNDSQSYSVNARAPPAWDPNVTMGANTAGVLASYPAYSTGHAQTQPCSGSTPSANSAMTSPVPLDSLVRQWPATGGAEHIRWEQMRQERPSNRDNAWNLARRGFPTAGMNATAHEASDLDRLYDRSTYPGPFHDTRR